MRQLLGSQKNNGWGLRIEVRGGGCSGFSYSMSLTDRPGDHDRVFEVDGVRIICDPKSYIYLNGLELDYCNEMMGGGFKFNKPEPVRACSCGTLFGI